MILEEEKKPEFTKEMVLQNAMGFFYNGINFDSHFQKIAVIEHALNRAHDIMVDAIVGKTTKIETNDKGSTFHRSCGAGTHCHKKNAVYTYLRLVEMLRGVFIHDDSYYPKYLAAQVLAQFTVIKADLEALDQLYLKNAFSHRELDILNRPYIFNIIQYGKVGWNEFFVDYRKELGKELCERILHWAKTETVDPQLLTEVEAHKTEFGVKVISFSEKSPLPDPIFIQEKH